MIEREFKSLDTSPAWVSEVVGEFVENAPNFEIMGKAAKMQYTKPGLRERLKRQIMAGGKGGNPGQWSARKAQMLAAAYRKAGGGYRGGLGKTQRSLKKWTREKWTTSDGKKANRPGGMRRYLPAAAWARMTPEQRRATNRKKILGSRSGRQFVANTEKAKNAGRAARKA